MAHYPGGLINIKLTITDPDDLTLLVDPTAVTVELEAPDGTLSVPTVTHTGVGKYQFSFTPAQVGMWRWVVTTTGTYAGVQPGVLNVDALPSGM